MVKAYYNTEPEAILYMTPPIGEADVWLRKNIEEIEVANDEGEPAKMWTADEVYFRAKITLAEVEENFDALFENEGPVTDPDTGTIEPSGITLADRVSALEEKAKSLEAEVEALEEWHDEELNKLTPDDELDV